MEAWLAIGLGVAIATVLVFRAIAKRSLLRGRTPLPLEHAYASVKGQVSFEVFREVWSALGKAYGIDPRLLRPTDTFIALGKMDSWRLGKGEDEIEEWLQECGLGTPPRVRNLLEFAQWVQSSAVADTRR